MKKPDILEFNHIAVIQTAFLGDVALAVPLVNAIKTIHPEVRISFVSTPAAAGITSSVKNIDSIVTYDKRGIRKGWDGIKFLSNHLKEINIDCIISCHRSLRTSLVTFLTNPDYSVGFNTSAFSFAYKRRIKYVKGRHEIDRNLSLLSAFSNDFDFSKFTKNTELDISENDINFVDSILHQNNVESEKMIAIAPGSVWETKKWKKEHFIDLANMLDDKGYVAVLIGSEPDKKLCDDIAAYSSAISFGGKFSIAQTLYLLSLSRLLITNDSAPTHFAGLVDCPVLTIFGPTSPIFGFAPWSTKSASLGLDELKCKPCAIHGGSKCPINTHDCMEKLSPMIVLETSLRLIEN